MTAFEHALLIRARVSELSPVKLLVLIGHVVWLQVKLATGTAATEHGTLRTILLSEERSFLVSCWAENGSIREKRSSGCWQLLEFHPTGGCESVKGGGGVERLRGYVLELLSIYCACDRQSGEEDGTRLHDVADRG